MIMSRISARKWSDASALDSVNNENQIEKGVRIKRGRSVVCGNWQNCGKAVGLLFITWESSDARMRGSLTSRCAKRPSVSIERNKTKRSLDSSPRVTVASSTAEMEHSVGSSSVTYRSNVSKQSVSQSNWFMRILVAIARSIINHESKRHKNGWIFNREPCPMRKLVSNSYRFN